MSKNNLVFISHASEDNVIAKRLYEDLSEAGIEPWLDSMSLSPGEDWQRELQKAIKASSVFLALISSKSTTKRGFTQRELTKVLEKMNTSEEADVYIVPVRVDNCQLYDTLQHYQVVDLFPSYSEGRDRLIRLLKRFIDIKSHKNAWLRK